MKKLWHVVKNQAVSLFKIGSLYAATENKSVHDGMAKLGHDVWDEKNREPVHLLVKKHDPHQPKT